MKLTVIITTDDIEYDREACSKVEGLVYEYLHVRQIKRLVERTHYTYGEPVLIEMDVEVVDGVDDSEDELNSLYADIGYLQNKIEELESELEKHQLSSQEGEKA